MRRASARPVSITGNAVAGSTRNSSHPHAARAQLSVRTEPDAAARSTSSPSEATPAPTSPRSAETTAAAISSSIAIDGMPSSCPNRAPSRNAVSESFGVADRPSGLTLHPAQRDRRQAGRAERGECGGRRARGPARDGPSRTRRSPGRPRTGRRPRIPRRASGRASGGRGRRCRRPDPGGRSPTGWRTACRRAGVRCRGRAPAQRLGQVVEGGDEVAEEPGPPAGGGAADDLADRGDDVVGEAVVRRLERAAATQAVEGELPDRLEQAVPRLGSARVDRDERGMRELVQQRVERDGVSTEATAAAVETENGPANTASSSNSRAAGGDSRS